MIEARIKKNWERDELHWTGCQYMLKPEECQYIHEDGHYPNPVLVMPIRFLEKYYERSL